MPAQITMQFICTQSVYLRISDQVIAYENNLMTFANRKNSGQSAHQPSLVRVSVILGNPRCLIHGGDICAV